MDRQSRAARVRGLSLRVPDLRPAARPDAGHRGHRAVFLGHRPFTFTQPLYVGRGIPNTWIAAGQTIAASNLTSSYNATSYNATSGTRSTYGVSVAVTKPGATRVGTVSITGTPPGGPIEIQLPVFLTTGVNSVTGGSYNPSANTVTATSTGATQVTITLAS